MLLLAHLFLLLCGINNAAAFPELRRRNEALPIHPRIVAEVEKEHGVLSWLTEGEHDETFRAGLDKRQSGPWVVSEARVISMMLGRVQIASSVHCIAIDHDGGESPRP